MSSAECGIGGFTDGFVLFQRLTGSLRLVRDVEFIERVCDNFLALCEASGLLKKDFAASVGLSPSQLTNISKYRNPPHARIIAKAAAVYGVTTDFFYSGNLGGMRDEAMASKLRTLVQRKPVSSK